MDDDYIDWKPDIVKLESELILDDDVGTDTDFEAPYAEAISQVPCETDVEKCSASPKRFELNLAYGLPSIPKPISSMSQIVTNAMVKMKEEIIEDPPFCSESSVDKQQNSLRETVFLPIYEESAFAKEEINIKTEDGLEKESTASNTNRQVDFLNEVKIEEPSVDGEQNSLPETVYLPAYEESAFANGEINVKTEDDIKKERTASNTNQQVDFLEETKIEGHSTDDIQEYRRREDSAPVPVIQGSSLFTGQRINIKVENYFANKGEAPDSMPQQIAFMKANTENIGHLLPAPELDLHPTATIHSAGTSFIYSNNAKKFVTNNSAQNLIKFAVSKQSSPPKQCSATSPPNTDVILIKAGMPDKELISCNQCYTQFNNKSSFKIHSLTHSDKRGFPCELCSANFNRLISLKRHSLIHSKEKRFSCDQCSANFYHKSSLQRHLLIHSKEKKFSCEQCSAKFSLQSNLKQHLLIHSNERRFSCELCPGKFTQKCYLRKHLLSHLNERKFSCELCPSKFNCINTLRRHMLIHSREKIFSCELCSSKFNHVSSYKQHMLIHSKEKRFSCEQCCAKFITKSSLNQHLLIHSNEKKFSCELCPAKFNQKGNLAQHLLIHSKEKRFSCEQCSVKFNYKGNLRNHSLTHSNEKRFSCEQCSAKFNRKSDLRQHLLVHSNERKFSCEQCSAKFKYKSNLREHLYIHSNEKRFSCEHCSAKFTRKIILQRHLLMHS